MKIIQENPYRLLGIYGNSSIKDRVANSSKLKAFLKVGKSPDFPLDLSRLLPAISRTIESVGQAESQLSLPDEQIKFAQFWFVKVTPLDEVAFNHLFAGKIEEAVSIWEKKSCTTSLQNRIVCALISENYATALSCAEELYTQHTEEFIQLVLGDRTALRTDNLALSFLDTLSAEIDINSLLPYISIEEWKNHLTEKEVNPLIDAIQAKIETAKKTRGNSPEQRLEAGRRLRRETVTLLQRLRQFFIRTDPKYQSIADKAGLEILQCGIDYYNDSADNPSVKAHKAMELQSYALSVVVGSMAKSRCEENVNILKKIIAELPPLEVAEEEQYIRKELETFSVFPPQISYAVSLLNNTKPKLQSIKNKLGANNSYYLKISTAIVNHALYNIIEEVNDAQNDESSRLFSKNNSTDIQSLLKLITIKNVLEKAWEATLIMDSFDMEYDYKKNRYNANRAILKNLCEQLGVSTSTHVSTPASTQQSRSSSNTPSVSSNDSDDKNWGCLIIEIIIAVAIIMTLILNS